MAHGEMMMIGAYATYVVQNLFRQYLPGAFDWYVVAAIPASLGPHMAIVTGLLSIPFTFFLSNDAFYFGVLPILNQAAATYGISAAEMGRASVIGQPVHLLSPLVPSTYLLVGLAGVELGDHQRFTLKWSFVTSLVLLAVGLMIGVIPFRSG